MQVVHFPKALLAFSAVTGAFLRCNRPEKPANKGQAAVARPFAICKYTKFSARKQEVLK